jgi:EpsI family protein
MNLALRLLFAASIVGGFQLGADRLSRYVEPRQVALPLEKLNAIPMQIDSWQGRPSRLDPDLVAATGADATLHRMYENPQGLPVAMDVAVYTRYELQVPHDPALCYESNGWNIVRSYPFALGDNPHAQAPGRLMFCQRGPRERVIVLYWYQLGEEIVLDRAGMRRAQWKLRGRHEWPPLVKVMLQTPCDGASRAPRRLDDFARLLLPHVEAIGP